MIALTANNRIGKDLNGEGKSPPQKTFVLTINKYEYF